MQTRVLTQSKAPPTDAASGATGLNDPGLLAPLSTPFDIAESPLTLATPSCCCCCCCCLATIASAQTYLAADVYYNAERNNRPKTLPLVLVFAGVAAGIFAMWLADNAIYGLILWGLFAIAGLRSSGQSWLRAIGITIAIVTTTAFFAVIEFFAFIFTLGIATLIATPLGILGAWSFAKKICYADEDPKAPTKLPTTADDGRPLEPPRPDAIAPPLHPIDPGPPPTLNLIDPDAPWTDPDETD